MTRRQHLARLLLPAVVLVAYRLLLLYADRARSLETVLGLAHGDPAWHALVAAAVVLLRFTAYAAVGGTVVAWPLEAWLRARTAPAAPPLA